MAMNGWTWFLGAHVALACIGVVGVLRGRKEPMAMLAWVMGLSAIPLLGFCFYAVFGADRVVRRVHRKRRRIVHRIQRFSRRAELQADAAGKLLHAGLSDNLAGVEQIGRRLVGMPATNDNQVEVYNDANAIYSAMEESIRGAKKHVHLEYYIWQDDATGRHFRDLLIEKAREGVECRLLLDAVGCFRLSKRFTKRMVDAGVEVAFFMPLYPLRRRWAPHLRNHRKVVVVDGCTGFLGSQNVGDEYRGRLKRLSPWHDSQMRVRGSAALFLQQIFAEDWLFATRNALHDDRFFPAPVGQGTSIVQILPTGPDQGIDALEHLLFAALEAAQETIHIATPYFVPSHAIRMALIHARFRGVKVKLVLPTRTDAKIALWAGRSYYAELLEGGVEVYELDRGMLHSKIATVDNRWGMLGSANMDMRSFRLNFEITALIYDEGVAAALVKDIEEHCANGRRVDHKSVLHPPIRKQLIEGAARLCAPLI